MRHHTGTRAAPQFRHATNMVGVSMSEQDGVHLADLLARLTQGVLHLGRPAGQSSVDKHNAVVDHDHMDVDKTHVNFEDSVHQFTHTPIVPPRHRTYMRATSGPAGDVLAGWSVVELEPVDVREVCSRGAGA